MARSIAQTPTGTDIIRVGKFYSPVILRPEGGPVAFDTINQPNGFPVIFSRRYAAVQYLWRRERENEEYGDPQGPLTAANRLYENGEEPWEE